MKEHVEAYRRWYTCKECPRITSWPEPLCPACGAEEPRYIIARAKYKTILGFRVGPVLVQQRGGEKWFETETGVA